MVKITFDESLNSASASNPALYHLFSGVKKKGKTVYTKPVKIKTVTYDDHSHSVTINLAKPFKGAVQVTVQGGLMAANGASTSGAFISVVK